MNNDDLQIKKQILVLRAQAERDELRIAVHDMKLAAEHSFVGRLIASPVLKFFTSKTIDKPRTPSHFWQQYLPQTISPIIWLAGLFAQKSSNPWLRNSGRLFIAADVGWLAYQRIRNLFSK